MGKIAYLKLVYFKLICDLGQETYLYSCVITIYKNKTHTHTHKVAVKILNTP